MLKSFLNFVGESEEQMEDLRRLRELGLIDNIEYAKEAFMLYPEKWKTVTIDFEFDYYWSHQTDPHEAVGLIKEFYAEFGPNTPYGCWGDPSTVWVSEEGWDDEEDEDGESYATGSMEMIVPRELSEHGLKDWANNQEGRVFLEVKVNH